MKSLCSIIFAALLVFGGALTTVASASPPQETAIDSNDQIPDAGEPQETDENVIIATVKEIDHKHGLVYLDSEIGQILTFATVAELQNLRTGDVVVVQVVDEEPEQNLLQDTIIT